MKAFMFWTTLGVVGFVGFSIGVWYGKRALRKDIRLAAKNSGLVDLGDRTLYSICKTFTK